MDFCAIAHGEAMKPANASIVRSCYWLGWWSLLANNGRQAGEQEGIQCGRRVLRCFSFHHGQEQVLDEASNIVITESTAKAFFEMKMLWAKLSGDNQYDLKVAGIWKIFRRTSVPVRFFYCPTNIGITQTRVRRNESNWGNYSFQVL